MKPALLVIDIQKKYFDNSPAIARSLEDAVDTVNDAIELFRKKNLPVIAIQHMDAQSGFGPGNPRFELPETLNILPSDVHIHKAYKNGFNKTGLAEELRKLGVDTVIVTGYSAEHCVLSTCRAAEDHDLTPVLLRDALASSSAEIIRFIESISEVISFGALEKALE